MKESPFTVDAHEARPHLLLDACALINLYACGHLGEILESIPASFGIVTRVRDEALFIRRGGGGEDAQDSIPIDLDDALSRGLLRVVADTTDEELNTFIDLAVDLGDGEAMTAAIALHRRYTVVTDDRVAVRIVNGRVPTVASLELIKEWIERARIPRDIASSALIDLRQRGRYLPGRTHPLRNWWENLFPDGY